MFEVFLTNRAEKGIKSLDEIKLRRRIEEAIDALNHTYFPKRYDSGGIRSHYRHYTSLRTDFARKRRNIFFVRPTRK